MIFVIAVRLSWGSLIAGGGPMSLRLLLEGESLLNDASSITLFTIFLSEVQDYRDHKPASGGEVLGNIVSKMLWLAVGGAAEADLPALLLLQWAVPRSAHCREGACSMNLSWSESHLHHLDMTADSQSGLNQLHISFWPILRSVIGAMTGFYLQGVH